MELNTLNSVVGLHHLVQDRREVGDAGLPVLVELHPQATIHQVSEGEHEGDVQMQVRWHQGLKLL